MSAIRTITEFQAEKVERIALALAHFVATTPEDRLHWRPAAQANSDTRSVLDQIGECIVTNRRVAALLRGQSAPALEEPPALSGSRQAGDALIASARDLAGAMRALDDAALERTFASGRGPVSGAVLIEAPYRNMAYHAGQVNFIQRLLGDTTFHTPDTWF